jgi:hypothetical protein
MAEKKIPTMAEARKEASGILFAIAILQLICGGILIALAPQIMGAPIPDDDMVFFIAEWFGIAVVFALLGLWARVLPLPPVIIGLILYVSLAVAAAVVNPETIKNGIIVKIVIILGLIRAIRTCLSATPDDPADAWAEDSSGTDDWDGRSSGKRHDPEKDGYS